MLLREAHRAGIVVIEQFVTDDYDGYLAPVETHLVDDRTLRTISDTESPRGVVAVCQMPDATPLDRGDRAWFLVLSAISDPGNAGTLVRSAEAAGVDGVVWVGSTVDPWSPKAVRSSAGALFHVPMWFCDDLARLGEHGIRLIGSSSHLSVGDVATKAMHDVDFSGRIGIVLGNEAHGLDDDAPVDEWVRVEHVGRSESLNVAMAGTILVMHAGHLRRAGSIDHDTDGDA